MYLLIFVAVLLFGVQTLCFKEFNLKYMKNKADYFLFSSLYFVLVVVALLAVYGFGSVSPQTYMIAIPFGVVFIASILLYMKAMETGSMSFSALVFSFGLLVPVLFGQLFWQENIRFLQILALGVLFISFYLAGGSKQEPILGFNVKWLVLSLAAMLGNGALMTMAKAHQRMLPGKDVGEFLIVAFATAALVSLLLTAYRVRIAREQTVKPTAIPFLVLVFGAGLTTAFGNWTALSLAGKIPAVVLFPLMNGGIVFLSSILSVAVYKEKLTSRSVAGLILGLFAIVLICL